MAVMAADCERQLEEDFSYRLTPSSRDCVDGPIYVSSCTRLEEEETDVEQEGEEEDEEKDYDGDEEINDTRDLSRRSRSRPDDVFEIKGHDPLSLSRPLCYAPLQCVFATQPQLTPLPSLRLTRMLLLQARHQFVPASTTNSYRIFSQRPLLCPTPLHLKANCSSASAPTDAASTVSSSVYPLESEGERELLLLPITQFMT
ncbi:hypothetical protein TcWFU_005384 [Taenia crassiceps]|uniref:Uncharacterized protein n=1 Tax=Taenia crassiceps TaxID=6207 RepID=A0ABR4PZM7_9CEST